MKEIKLTQGKVALVDDVDYEWLNQFTWSVGDGGYPQARVYGKTTRMHKLLLSSSRECPVDHINMNKLDNQKANLRNVSLRQNAINRGKQVNNKSGFKGVYWRVDKRMWQAGIHVYGKTFYLGIFKNILDAAYAYDNAARRVFGEFARLNGAQKE